jgi:ABC-type antimicrobial peptide transport system permease subunit
MATQVFPFASRIVPGLSMPGVIVVVGLACGVLVALISAAVPALLAARLQVATALARH